MTIITLIISAVAIFFLIGILTGGKEKEVKIAYAGSAHGKPEVKKIPSERNKTIYTDGDEIVNLSKYDTFLISGDSLAPAGLKSGTYVYTLKPSETINPMGKFVIFKYDVARQAQEHPEKSVTNESYKARKAVRGIKTGLKEDAFKEIIGAIIERDDEITEKENAISALWKKYEFASNFYRQNDVNELIVSMTYRDGKDKSYSFHSPTFLSGIVMYKSA